MDTHISVTSGPSLTEEEDAVISADIDLSDFPMKTKYATLLFPDVPE